jgi:uncharacterized protein (DUF2235 family)
VSSRQHFDIQSAGDVRSRSFVVSKNIVVCLDGTGNQLKAKGNTNVVRLYEMLELGDPSRQIAYYDPGVGTFGAQGAWTPLARRLTKLAGLAVGYGLRTNLAEAYIYLMHEYEEGDQALHIRLQPGSLYGARARRPAPCHRPAEAWVGKPRPVRGQRVRTQQDLVT